MKKVSLLFAIMFAIFTASVAQTATQSQPVPADRTMAEAGHGGHRGEGLKKKLGLTDDQAAKIKALHESQKAKHQAIRDNASLTKDQRKAQMAELRAAQDQEIKGILTPAQYTQYTQMLADGKEKMKEKRMEKKAGN